MKARILSFAVLATAVAVLFTSCQKDTKTDETDFTAQSSAHADDQSRFSNEVDAVANDANSVLEVTGGFSGRINTICDATVAVDTLSNPRTITITYNGTNCLGNRTRTGVVVISMAQNVR